MASHAQFLYLVVDRIDLIFLAFFELPQIVDLRVQQSDQIRDLNLLLPSMLLAERPLLTEASRLIELNRIQLKLKKTGPGRVKVVKP